MPRVSVIIPAHNAAAHLEATLRSVQAQTHPDWEVVVADDGSTYQTPAIASGFDPRVRLVRQEVNAGPAAARNLAVENARGELLALLDADDLWLPEYLEQQVRLFDEAQDRYGNVGIVACDARPLAPDGPELATRAQQFGSPDNITVSGLLKSNPIFVSAVVPRDLVVRLGGFSTETFGSEDHDLWLRIVEAGYRVSFNPRPLALYRLSGSSVSASVAGMARTSQATYRRALDRGNLTWRQRRLARRQLRLQRAVERMSEDRRERRSLRRMLGSLPLYVVVALEHPQRWGSWIREIKRWHSSGGRPAD